MPIDTPTPRRGFLGRIAATVAAASLPWRKTHAHAAGSAAQDIGLDDFLEGLDGRYKYLFDTPNLGDGGMFAHVRNYMRAYTDTFGVAQSDVDAIVTLYTPDPGSTQSLAFTDAMWEKYAIGEFANLSDTATGRPLVRNMFYRPQPGDPVPASMSITALQERGVTFLTCANSLRAFSGALARAGLGESDAIRADLLANLLPGVILVPSVAVAIERAQAHGFAYKRE
ncbi:MAG: hypothetical protein QF664_14360 [Dehalococcoidia bacterium]|jgi:intracellular sulfur oxidation DsrE/DsrF family protein|nr:hypothetical protein [Dehalococcoidia bacterium]